MTLAELLAAHAVKMEKANALTSQHKIEAIEGFTAKISGIMDEADEISAKIKALEAEEEIMARVKAAEAALPSKTLPGSTLKDVKVGKNLIMDDPKRGFIDLSQFALEVAKASHTSLGSGMVDNRLREIQAASSGLNTGLGSEGGFTVPQDFSKTIWEGNLRTSESLMGMTDQFSVPGESLTLLGIDETSRATGSRRGGTRGFWIAEADQFTKSKPKFREIKIEPKELAVFTFVTEKLLRTSGVNLEEIIGAAAMDEIDFLVGDAIINGTGAGQPLGILTSNAPFEVAKESGQTADTVVAANIDKMYQHLSSRWRAGSIWFVNKEVIPSLESLETANGEPLFRGPTGLGSAPMGTLKGIPIMDLEYCPKIGDVGDIILCNMGAYATGMQGGVRSASSMHLRFDFAEMAFRWMFSIDGQPWNEKPVTAFKGSIDESPFVTLAARA